MMKFTDKDLKDMIIQEMKTGSPYYGDEHHEKFDFKMAPYDSFLNSFEQMKKNLVDRLESEELSYNELQYLGNDLMDRIRDSIGYLDQVVSLKLKDARNKET